MTTSGGKLNAIQDEFVRMLRLHFVLLKDFRGKILQIHRDNHLHLTPDGRGKYMAVVFVWQAQGWNQMLIAFDKRINSRSPSPV